MRLSAIFCVIGTTLFSAPAFAIFQMDFLKGKNQAKSSSQFTIADWLTQKGKMKLSDQWLALNRAGGGWFEFNPSAAHTSYKVKTTTGGVSSSLSRDSQRYTADMYVSILNLYGEYEKSSDHIEEYGGAAGLRLFGTSSQSTNLIARYGFQRRQNLSTQERWDNPYVEGLLQLYILQNFGITGQYRYYFPKDSNLGTKLEGHKVTAGAFFDVAIFRLYANYYQQPMKLNSNTADEREGYEAGVKLYF